MTGNIALIISIPSFDISSDFLQKYFKPVVSSRANSPTLPVESPVRRTRSLPVLVS